MPADATRIGAGAERRRTVLVVLREAEVLGLLGVADPLREEARGVVSKLRGAASPTR